MSKIEKPILKTNETNVKLSRPQRRRLNKKLRKEQNLNENVLSSKVSNDTKSSGVVENKNVFKKKQPLRVKRS